MANLHGSYIDPLSSVSPKSGIIFGKILVAYDAIPVTPYLDICMELDDYYLIDSSKYFEKIRKKIKESYTGNDILWSDNNYFNPDGINKGAGEIINPKDFKNLFSKK